MEEEKKWFSLQNVEIRLKKGKSLYAGQPINSAERAIELMHRFLGEMDREYVVVVNMNAKNIPLNFTVASIGTIECAVVHPREIFKAAILCNASSIIMLHNHTSGKVKPSKRDIEITERMEKACEIMGINLLDHVIIGENLYYSFQAKEEKYYIPKVEQGKVAEMADDPVETELVRMLP